MTTMPFEDLETAYETLATAIDTAGAQREALFLTRLALVRSVGQRRPRFGRARARP